MINKQGSLLIQTLINLMIFAMFMTITFQSIFILSKPITINHLKYEYLQLQLHYLATLYNGAILQQDQICFKDEHCLKINNHRLILTPGYQVLLENIASYIILDTEESIQLKILHRDEWNVFYVKK